MPRHEPWNAERASEIIARYRHLKGATLPILHALQDEFGYIPDAAVPLVAEVLNLSRAEVHGVVTFYHDFRTEPAGAHVLKLCRAEACQSAGGEALAARAESRARCRHRRDGGRRFGDARGGLLPRPLRDGAVGDDRRRHRPPTRRGSMRSSGRRSHERRASTSRDAGALGRRRRRRGGLR